MTANSGRTQRQSSASVIGGRERQLEQLPLPPLELIAVAVPDHCA
jgi:hypothetical protein